MLIRTSSQTIVLFLICLSFLKSSNVLLNLDLLNILLPIISLIPTSLVTFSTIPLKTALLYILDHLINAIGSQKVSCLCLLDLSAAFDTIDHNILLTRLSFCFGIQGSALDWFKSYLSSRSFRVKCNNNFSSCHTCICGVPQGSVLGPLLFILYTTPLSTLISSLSLNHHLYADDTQLFFSFYPSVFDSSITQLQRSLQKLSTWMTANLLTLNSSKTEFLLVGLPQQLAKINTSSLITTDSARNVSFIFDEHLAFSDQISALDFKTASTIATSVIHSKLHYCNSLYYNLTQSQVKKIQNTQNSLARAQNAKIFSHHSCSEISTFPENRSK